MDDWAREYDIIRVEPKDPAPDSWLHEDRFIEFMAAYEYATHHFSQAAVAFSKVTPEEAYRIWHTIDIGLGRGVSTPAAPAAAMSAALWERIAGYLRACVRDAPDQRLPSEARLMTQFDVARGTVR